MRGIKAGLVLMLVATSVVATARLSLKAQDHAPHREPKQGQDQVQNQPKTVVSDGGEAKTIIEGAVATQPDLPAPHHHPTEHGPSVVDALERPFTLPFGTPTRLEEACAHLRRILRAPVVLDRAALHRKDVRPDDPVELDLEGVRLKVGLKLLLDQVGLTYKVVPEDNLLIITDEQGADDPLRQVQAELKSLHRDLHDVQDAVDDLREALGLEGGPRMRKPTIIEELPEQPAEKKPDAVEPQSRSRSGI
ncbi:hypothetical protein [Singulisphaera sp. PoT]|uniref:hypothetical protein n=1 Tax=Singulisphaera sp. PoT TaxID=3411797 RepID=UPI003BF485A3